MIEDARNRNSNIPHKIGQELRFKSVKNRNGHDTEGPDQKGIGIIPTITKRTSVGGINLMQ